MRASSAPPLQVEADPALVKSKDFAQFYRYYLSEHRNRTCRRLHFVGSVMGVTWLLSCLALNALLLAPLCLLIGYAFAWVGHFVFEKNRPATFKRPLFSFMGDWVMFRDILTRRIPF